MRPISSISYLPKNRWYILNWILHTRKFNGYPQNPRNLSMKHHGWHGWRRFFCWSPWCFTPHHPVMSQALAAEDLLEESGRSCSRSAKLINTEVICHGAATPMQAPALGLGGGTLLEVKSTGKNHMNFSNYRGFLWIVRQNQLDGGFQPIPEKYESHPKYCNYCWKPSTVGHI